MPEPLTAALICQAIAQNGGWMSYIDATEENDFTNVIIDGFFNLEEAAKFLNDPKNRS